MKLLGATASIVPLAIVAVIGFVAYKKFIKKDMWGETMRNRIKRAIEKKIKKEKKVDKKEYWKNWK